MGAAVTVRVVFSPVFRAVLQCGGREVALPEADASVRGLLLQLSTDSSGKIDKLVFEKGCQEVSPGLMVQVNDRTYTGNALNREPVWLADGDTVSLLYYISGG